MMLGQTDLVFVRLLKLKDKKLRKQTKSLAAIDYYWKIK